jgi:hypothetical protein
MGLSSVWVIANALRDYLKRVALRKEPRRRNSIKARRVGK